MKSFVFAMLAALAVLAGVDGARGQSEAAAGGGSRDWSHRQLIVAPSSTGVMLGTARLEVNPLTYKGGRYVGDYRVTVSPYSFKSQNGPLYLDVPLEKLQKLGQGQAVDFTGKATNSASGVISDIAGSATPSAKGDRGAASFTITTKGEPKLVFKTTFHYGK